MSIPIFLDLITIMFEHRRRFLLHFFKFSDICIFLFAMLAALLLMINSERIISLEEFYNSQIKLTDTIGFLCALPFWHFSFSFFGLYESKRFSSRISEWVDITKATSAGTIFLALYFTIFNANGYNSYFFMVFWLCSTGVTILFRSFLRLLLGKIRIYGRNLRHILIVGTNQIACDFASRINTKKEIGLRVLGFVDNKIHSTCPNMNLLGSFDDFPSIIRDNVVDEIFISLPMRSHYDKIQKIVLLSEKQGIIVRYASQPFNTQIAKTKAEKYDDFTILTYSSGFQEKWQYFLKRVFDFVLVIIFIILAFPVVLVAAAVIKISDKGPVFFIQKRVGYHKRIFRLYKLRTMVVDAEVQQIDLEKMNEMDGPVFKIKNDPRITTFGHWLRKMSIDELPQLLNVVKGDMSLVGPRPLPVRDYNGFGKDWQLRRFSVLPGITCTWQISGRSNIPFEKWMQLDMEYIDNWSFMGDVKILLLTIPSVFIGRGAA